VTDIELQQPFIKIKIMENQEQKENYQSKIESQLDEWRADIDRLREKARNAKAESKLKYQESIDKLELKLDEGKSRLKELKESGADAWDAVKDGADSIWDTMKATFKEVKEKFKDDDEVKE
jgi:chromosome segregation ATPase